LRSATADNYPKVTIVTIDYLSLAVSDVKRLAPYIPGKAIEELEREAGLPASEIIKLVSNEAPLMANPRVIAAIQDELSHITRYPNGNGFRLKKRLSKGIIVRPLASYGMPNHLRISVGMPPENTRFLDALHAILSEGA
jgi:histidinol-phosphate/aromatic aminotransferase/cobyric acid decarboxylase-like protein